MGPVDSRHKGTIMRKMWPCLDACTLCKIKQRRLIKTITLYDFPFNFVFINTYLFILWWFEIQRKIVLNWVYITLDCVKYRHTRVLLNTFRPRQNGRHFPYDIFKRIFWNENVWILIKNSLTYVPKGPINNNPALLQIMAWRQTVIWTYFGLFSIAWLGAKPLSEPILDYFQLHP